MPLVFLLMSFLPSFRLLSSSLSPFFLIIHKPLSLLVLFFAYFSSLCLPLFSFLLVSSSSSVLFLSLSPACIFHLLFFLILSPFLSFFFFALPFYHPMSYSPFINPFTLPSSYLSPPFLPRVFPLFLFSFGICSLAYFPFSDNII